MQQYRLSKGQVINETYEVLALIGEGGSAVIYKALQLNLNRIVAVKILKEACLDSEDWLQRFQREARIMAGLRHPHIVSCFSAGIWHGRVPFLVFEYLQGKSLRELIRERGSLDLQPSLQLGMQICDALAQAHTLNFVHRDLKPENIMLVADEKGGTTTKILDFGIAAMLGTDEKLTKSGLLIGSTSYMSPEQCQGKSTDQRSDIYSTGCVLYECLTGIPPQQADSPMGLIYKHINQYPKRVSELKKNVPEALDLLILKAMAKDPSDRYQNASEMLTDLAKLNDSIEKKIELGSSQINLSPAVLQASGQELGKSLKMTKFAAVLALISMTVVLMFFLSDPGPASLLTWSASFRPAEGRVEFFENTGDQMVSYKRERAAGIFYTNALKYTFDTPGRMRLLSKMSVLALRSGRTQEAARCAVMYFDALKEPNCNEPEMESLKKILSVIEFVPISWTNDMYIKSAELELLSIDKDYPYSYCTQFLMMIADSEEADAQMIRLQNLFLAIFTAEFHNDMVAKCRVIIWAQKHLHKFGIYQHLLKPILSKLVLEPTNKAGKGLLMQTVIDTCVSSGCVELPEGTGLLLVAARNYANIGLSPKETFDTAKLQTILCNGKNSQASLVSHLLVGQACAAKADYAGCFRHTSEAVRMLSKFEDRNGEALKSLQLFREWAVYTIDQSITACPQGAHGRFELLAELAECLGTLPVSDNSRLIKYTMTQLFFESIELHRYEPAENIMRECLRKATPRVNPTHFLYDFYHLLSELYRHDKKYAAMKELLIEADNEIKVSNSSPEETFPVLISWSNYYWFVAYDLEKALVYRTKAIEGAEHTADPDEISSYKLSLVKLKEQLQKSKK